MIKIADDDLYDIRKHIEACQFEGERKFDRRLGCPLSCSREIPPEFGEQFTKCRRNFPAVLPASVLAFSAGLGAACAVVPSQAIISTYQQILTLWVSIGLNALPAHESHE